MTRSTRLAGLCHRNPFWAICVAALASMFASQVAAGPPPATVSATVYGADASYGPGSYTAGGAGYASASIDGGTATTGLTPTPSVEVSGTASTGSQQYAQAAVVTNLEFVNAMTSTVTVDVDFTANVANPAGTMCCGFFGEEYAATPGVSISWGVYGSYSNEVFSCGISAYQSGCPAGAQVVKIALPSGSTDFIQIVAGAVAGWSFGPAGYSASLDPFISIDPLSLTQNPGISFELSPNVGNGAVPEPSSWTLALAGLGALGFALRTSPRRPAKS